MIDALISAARDIRFRGKVRLLNPIVPAAGRRAAKVFGYTMTLDLADFVQRMIYLGCYEPEETRLIGRHLRPGMTFLDVGANVGYFTLLASHKVGPTGRVISVEPGPAAREVLLETKRVNELPAEVHPIGLSDQDATLALYLPADEAHNFTPTMVAGDANSRRVDVPVRRLDHCLDAWGVERVDLLKIDVEGHEPKVFEGGARSLAAGRVRAILCEFNDYWLRQAGSSPQALHDRLTGFGFRDVDGPPKFTPNGLCNRFLVFSGQ